MIYQPRNVQPSASAIDAGQDNIFSMEIQTNTYVKAYQLLINDFDNNAVYTGSKVTLSNYIYNEGILNITVPADTLTNGKDYKWRVKLYQQSADMLITYGLVQQAGSTTNIYTQPNINIKSGMQIKVGSQTQTISSYNIETGLLVVSSAFSTAPAVGDKYSIYSDFIETIPDYLVYARQNPVISITNVPVTLTLKYHTFTGNYSQANNVPITYHQFDLYILNDNGKQELIDSSGKVYSADLTYSYDAFRTNNTYYIQMTIQNDMGIITETTLYSFDVDYEIVEYLQQPSASFNPKDNSINVAWVAPVENKGKAFSTITGDEVNFEYLLDTPYNGVNSLYTRNYETKWSADDGLCVLPELYNITFQFNPDTQFFYNENSQYSSIAPFLTTDTDDENNENSWQIILNTNKLALITPHITNGALDVHQIVTPPAGEQNTLYSFYISGDIDDSLSYIVLDNNVVREIDSYDDSTHLLTIKTALDAIPEIGDTFYTNDSIETYFYTNATQAFVLSSSNIVQLNKDYIWMDDETWDDTFYWVEGGTSLERVCGHWWKVQITNTQIKVEEVYPST